MPARFLSQHNWSTLFPVCPDHMSEINGLPEIVGPQYSLTFHIAQRRSVVQSSELCNGWERTEEGTVLEAMVGRGLRRVQFLKQWLGED